MRENLGCRDEFIEGIDIAGMNERGFNQYRDESERTYAKQGCMKAVNCDAG
jgi:hypothetical protein